MIRSNEINMDFLINWMRRIFELFKFNEIEEDFSRELSFLEKQGIKKSQIRKVSLIYSSPVTLELISSLKGWDIIKDEFEGGIVNYNDHISIFMVEKKFGNEKYIFIESNDPSYEIKIGLFQKITEERCRLFQIYEIPYFVEGRFIPYKERPNPYSK